MDLGACANIEDLDGLAKKNGIYCPRLRGYRLMKDEDPVCFGGADVVDDVSVDCVRSYIFRTGFTNKNFRRRWKKYIIQDNRVNWKNIHGKMRKEIKWHIRSTLKHGREQFSIFNKYCGREDVLMIHSRIGDGNWDYYRKYVEDQPWFIEKVDDWYDSTYCDIYARIEVT